MARKIVIGDIHGALRALKQLFFIISLRPDDQLIFLGDYVDGWSQSADVIEFLVDLEKVQECIFIKGNHDAWCESWLKGEGADEDWLFHGGYSTVQSYRSISREEKTIHSAFFEKMRHYYVDDANRLFVHAGFSSIHVPGSEQFESSCLWDRTLWQMALAMDSQLTKVSKLNPERLLLFREIFIGHTPTLNYNVTVPMHACNVWNIDTGAAFYGKLSAMNIETKEYWQSDAPQQLYPGEKGRDK